MKRIEQFLQKYHKERLIWCLLAMAFCWTDIGEYHHMAANKQLVVWMAVALFYWYKLKIVRTWKTGTTALSVLAGLVLTIIFITNNVFSTYWFYNYTLGVNLILWLPVVANIGKRMWQEKRFFRLNVAASLILLMCLIMQLSPNTNRHGFLVIGLFLLPIYFCPLEKEEKTDMLSGIIDGFCLGFLVTQAYAFGFRHYQQGDGRYTFYRDYCTFAGQSYLMFFIAWMMKYLYYAKEKKIKWKKNVCWWVSAFIVALMYLTGGRSPVMGVIGITAVVMLVRHVPRWSARNVGRWMLSCAVLGITSLLLFPTAYASVRYLPTIIGHPDYLDSESNRLYSFSTRVLKQKFLYNGEYTRYSLRVGDSADAVQYITFSESIIEALGRIIPGSGFLIPDFVYEDAFKDKIERYDYYTAQGWIVPKERDRILNNYHKQYFDTPYEEVEQSQDVKVMGTAARSDEIEITSKEARTYNTEKTTALRGETEATMWFPEGTAHSSMEVREAIHSFAIQHLNGTGHELFTFKMYLDPKQIIGHAHNIFLIIGYDYGIAAMLSMILFFVAIVVISWKKYKKTGKTAYLFPLCLIVGMSIFGFWESGFRSDNAFSIFIFITAACLSEEQRKENAGKEEIHEEKNNQVVAKQ